MVGWEFGENGRVWMSPCRAPVPRIEAAEYRMGWMDRMKAIAEAAWGDGPKHRVGSTGAIREGAVMSCLRPRSWFALRLALVP